MRKTSTYALRFTHYFLDADIGFFGLCDDKVRDCDGSRSFPD
jgi:hypothetical protein